MKAKDDIVLQALKAMERHTRARIYGGLLGLWKLSKAALVEYERRAEEVQPSQLMFEEVMCDDYSTA